MALTRPRPDRDELFPAAAVATPDPRWHHRTAAGAAGGGRLAGRLGVDQPEDRRAGRSVRGAAGKWGHRWWVQPGSAWWGDAKRSGRPPSFTPVQVAALKALACQPPKASGLPLPRWSCPDLAAQVVADGVAPPVSTSTVRRWLGPRRGQTLAVPVLDLRQRPELRRQGRGSWTCTTGSGTGDPCQQTTTSPPPTRRPRSKPGAGATHRCRQARPR